MAGTSVTVFTKEHVYFASGDDKRTVTTTVTFPDASEGYAKITMNVGFDYNNGNCDPWDRRGHFMVKKGDTWFEISRFMTAYLAGWTATFDVSEFRTLLSGTVEMLVFVDTWVSTGSYINLSFDFDEPGTATAQTQIISVFENQSVTYGNPSDPPNRSSSITIPAGVSDAVLYSFITGHGQGNTQNCAEFCPKNHTFTVKGTPYTKQIWRDNCADTVTTPGQSGTYQYSRAGWCPGSLVYPWKIDLNSLAPGAAEIDYAPEAYTNELRPPEHPYNDQGHTKPIYQLSSMLILTLDSAAGKAAGKVKQKV